MIIEEEIATTSDEERFSAKRYEGLSPSGLPIKGVRNDKIGSPSKASAMTKIYYHTLRCHSEKRRETPFRGNLIMIDT